MKIWELYADANNYENFGFAYENDLDNYMESDLIGQEFGNEWVPFEVSVIEKRKKGDCPSFTGGDLIFSEKAVKALGDLLKDNVEVLPLLYDKEKYYLINVLQLLDCVDYEKAEVIRFDSGDIMLFTRYAFKPESVRNINIFKIVDMPKCNVFVSDEFRNKVLESGLKGFSFEEVWDSDSK